MMVRLHLGTPIYANAATASRQRNHNERHMKMKTNANFTVKDNFKMPARTYGVGRKAVYPFKEMNIGQTAVFKLRSTRDKVRIRAAVSKVSADLNMKFMTRTLEDGQFAVQRLRANAS